MSSKNKEILTEEQFVSEFGRPEVWSKDNTTKLLRTIPHIAPEILGKVLDQIPNIFEEMKEIIITSRAAIDASKDQSSETKKYFFNISDRLLQLLEKPEASDIKKEILELIKENSKFVFQVDQADKDFLNKQTEDIHKNHFHTKTFLFGLVPLVLGGLLGAATYFNKNKG